MKFSTFSRGLAHTLLGCAALTALVGCNNADDVPTAATTSGYVAGVQANGVNSFKGIPYAVAERWKAPTAPASWTGVREAFSFGAHCPQGASPFGSASLTEDCQFLNVYTPTTPGPHPVMVWIHGGAFYLGLSDQYDPSRLVAQDTVVVTLNYRLGALGFMSHAALSAEQGGKSGNYGLMDQQAALRWVQSNIANFGGDKNNVTIFGESAGGFSVHSHIASPGSTGLFNKAIIMSGAYAMAAGAQDTLAAAETKGATVATTAGTNLGTAACTTAACLRALPVTAILVAQQTAWPSGPIPSVDGSVLPQSALARITAGTHNKVPVLQGNTQDEWRLFVALDEITPTSTAAPWKGAALTTTNYGQAVAGTFPFLTVDPTTIPGLIAHPTLSPYRVSAYSGSPSLALGAMGTDLLFACNARASSKLQEPYVAVYAYQFSDDTAPASLPAVSFSQGAAHTYELQYLFDLTGKAPLSTAQKAVASSMVGYWARFARAGNPNTTAAPTVWPAFGTSDDVLSFNAVGNTVTTDAAFSAAHKCAIWTPTVP
jgi:para-nitrobenzyl esterase